MAEVSLVSPTKWLEGFEFRGRPPGSILPLHWEIKIGVLVKDEFGDESRIIKGPFGVQRAKEMGIELARDIAPAINFELMAEVEREREALVHAQATAGERERELQMAISDQEAFIQSLKDQLAQALAKIS